MSLLEHMWDLLDWRIARNPRPVASKNELWLSIQALWNFLPQVDIQNLFDSMPCRIGEVVVPRGGYNKC